MTDFTPRSGYTLPVFACASALAALHHLHGKPSLKTVSFDLISPPRWVEIPIEQVASLGENQALAITRSEPGDNFDITRHTPIWAIVTKSHISQTEYESEGPQIILEGGEGIGKFVQQEGKAAIYQYAQELIIRTLEQELQPDERITVKIILPEGRSLAQRTSNHAFGIIEGLSLLGSTGISQPLTAPGQLKSYEEELKIKAARSNILVYCIGENGIALAQEMGIDPEKLIKTANWVGSLLVTGASVGLDSILIFGYHGKLIKLAGGIFHTHHYLADGRLEVLTAHCVAQNLPLELVQRVFQCSTTEQALNLLREQEKQGGKFVERVYTSIAQTIDQRAQEYIYKHITEPGGPRIQIGSILFDGRRQLILKSPKGKELLEKLC